MSLTDALLTEIKELWCALGFPLFLISSEKRDTNTQGRCAVAHAGQ